MEVTPTAVHHSGTKLLICGRSKYDFILTDKEHIGGYEVLVFIIFIIPVMFSVVSATL